MSDTLFNDPANTLVETNAELPTASRPSVADPGQLLRLAIERGIDPESLERLAALYERMEDRRAEAELTEALQQFQRICPYVDKTKAVYNSGGTSLLYTYAPFETVVDTIREHLETCGLTFAHTVEDKQVICTATHRSGATRKSAYPVGAWEGTKATNSTQKLASAISFAKRQSLLAVFGIATIDDDAAICHDNPARNADAPPAQPRGQRVGRQTVADSMALWKESNGGGGDWEGFESFVRETCELGEGVNLKDPNSWTGEMIQKCNAASETIMSRSIQ